MKTTRFLALILALVMVFGLFAGCGGTTEAPKAEEPKADAPAKEEAKTEAPAAAAEQKPIVFYANAIFNNLNPCMTSNLVDYMIAVNVYETLVTIDAAGTPQPLLAESWEASSDGLTYTFKLVEDAYFHNGENFKASDVVFTWENAKKYPGMEKRITMVDTVTAIDDYTVEFKLAYAEPMFLTWCADVFIFNEKFVTESADPDVKDAACGTGPYKVDSFNAATGCFLKATDDFRDGPADIKDVEIRYIADAASAVVAFEAGEINVMDAPPAQGQVLMASGNYNHKLAQSKHTATIAFNCQVEPFNNKLIRQAFSYAMDKETAILIAYEGFAAPARIQAGLDCFGVDFSDAPDISYNPEKAKELLAEAGYPDGLNLTEEFGIQFKTIAGGYHEKLGQCFIQNLKDIGVEVEIVATDTPDEDAKKGDFAFMNEGLSYRADFSYNEYQYCTAGIGGSNFNQYSDPWVDEMFEKGKLEGDPEVRKEIYRELIAYLVDACPSIPIMHKQTVFLWDKELNLKDETLVGNNLYRAYYYNWA